MRYWNLAVTLVCLGSASVPVHAAAQTQTLQALGYIDASEFGQELGGSVVIMGQSPVSADGSTAAPAGPTPRLQALQKLEFDRRASTILAAWATPPKKPEEAKPAKPAAEPPKVEEPAPPADETPEQAAARIAAKEAAAAAAAKAKEAAEKQVAETKAIAEEMSALQRNVTLGDWAKVREYFATLTEDERKGGFEKLLQSLQNGPQQRPQVPQQGQLYIEKNQFAPEDIVGLALAGPAKLEKNHYASLGILLRLALDSGHQLESFLAGIEPSLDDPAFGLDRRKLALILVAANEPRALEKLVPTQAEATEKNDRVGFNLISRYCLAMHAKDKKTTWLEQAWHSTQSVLAIGEVEEDAKKEALTRAVEIAPKIQAELGQAWLDESFTQRPERGMEILAAIGSASSLALAAEPTNADKRTKLLELQTTATKALLRAAPELAKQWSKELELLANNWLREAGVSYQYDDSTSLGPRMQRDYYGNFYYYDNSGMYRGNLPSAISTAKILEIRPDDGWLSHIDPTLAPRFQMIFAQLLLKVDEEGQAFPYIENLATTLPRQAKDLVDEFLRVWTKKNNPNAARGRTNQYMFFYGFEERAAGIPLTRSKQERNLAELSEWVGRLRKLPVELDDTLVANAFTTAHSSAEVFRLESIERIFGPVAQLKPSSIAMILETMRANLVAVWRDPALQEKNKTNRHQKDIQAEVLRGYALGTATVDQLIGAHPASHELWLVKAALAHDENNYRAELAKDSQFSSRRGEAFEQFHKAAQLYADNVVELGREKETTAVFDMWFYAALGACDLKAIPATSVLANAEITAIRDALSALPGECAERHTSMFASNLFTRMSSVGPAIKFRYVREGLAIAGDHKLARESRAVFDYYKDLVTEIQLRATIDGDDRVGHGEPFGLKIDIRHTREIERESGGFAKYLQNQNSQNFGYNYGRPLEDYRDKFDEALREGLKEHFEVLSVTFNDPQSRSKAEPEYGWRVTPYAYALLKPRSEAVDRVPPLRLDLDFLDTTGYAILPVESPAVPIDAKADEAQPRPFEKLTLTQTLDERQAKSGKLILEIKATATGLVPRLDSVLELAPAGFDIESSDDHGVSVVKFDEEGNTVNSERTWTVAMRARAGQPPPKDFSFGKPRVEALTSEHFRFVDADLATVGETIALESQYAKPSRAWMWWLPAGLVGLFAAVFVIRRTAKPKQAESARFQVPADLNAFTVLGLLRNIQSNNGLAPDQHRELGAEIQALERHYFGEEIGTTPDLNRIASHWVGRAR